MKAVLHEAEGEHDFRIGSRTVRSAHDGYWGIVSKLIEFSNLEHFRDLCARSDLVSQHVTLSSTRRKAKTIFEVATGIVGTNVVLKMKRVK